MARQLYKYKGPRCSKLIKCKLSKKLVSCDGDLGHKGRHTPYIKGLYTEAGILIEDRGVSKRGFSTWYLSGRDRATLLYNILSGNSSGSQVKLKRGLGSWDKKGHTKPEYSTWIAHFHLITNPKMAGHKNYKGVPFYSDWDPRNFNIRLQGYLNFEKWLKSSKSIGMRPSKKYSLDIVEHYKGFAPGNLRWACKQTQTRNQRHRTVFNLTVEQHRSALKPLGYDVVKSKTRRPKNST